MVGEKKRKARTPGWRVNILEQEVKWFLVVEFVDLLFRRWTAWAEVGESFLRPHL
jgi:hypothetical protein